MNQPTDRPSHDITSALANLEAALSMLRSAGEIARREGTKTNWPAFLAGVEAALAPFNMNAISPRTYRLPPYEHGDQSAN